MATTKTLSIVIAEDHKIVREGVKLLVNSEPDMKIVGEAGDGEEAIKLCKELHPDVVLMDLTMPGLDGITATRRIKAADPKIKIIALTRHDEDGYLQKLIEAGADGYALKQSPPSAVINAVRTVHDGGTYLDPSVTRDVLKAFSQSRTSPSDQAGELTSLETSVLRLVAMGHAYKEIAAALGRSARTIEVARATAMKKMKMETRVDIVKYAIAQGWMHDN
jgi:two-component system response regulator NreC